MYLVPRFGGRELHRLRRPVVFLYAVLVLLLFLSMGFYLARLKRADHGSEGEWEETGRAYGQLNLELDPPAEVEVTVEKGATIRWKGEDDARVIGYNVYRYYSTGAEGTRINAAIVSDTVYHDDEGTEYNSYAVAPVDANGREGPLSAAVAAVPEPSSVHELQATAPSQVVEDTTMSGSYQKEDLPPELVDCTAAGMSYVGVWYLEHYAEVTGGTLMVTPYFGDSVTYTFNGSEVAVIATRHWNYGIMDIYVDGEFRATVDLYAPEVRPGERVFTASGLGAGPHTIKLECTGRKNPQAYFTFVNMEALEIR